MFNFKKIFGKPEYSIRHLELPKDFMPYKTRANNILLDEYEENPLYSSAKHIIYFSEIERAKEIALMNLTNNSTNVVIFDDELAFDNTSSTNNLFYFLQEISLISPYSINLVHTTKTEFEIIENAEFVINNLLPDAAIQIKALLKTLLVALYYITESTTNDQPNQYRCSLKFIHSLIEKGDLRWIIQLSNILYEKCFDQNYAFTQLNELKQLASDKKIELINELKTTLEKYFFTFSTEHDEKHIFLHLYNLNNISLHISSSYNELNMKIFLEYYCKRINDNTPALFIINNLNKFPIFKNKTFIDQLLNKNIQVLNIITDHGFIHDYWKWSTHPLFNKVDYYILDNNCNAEISLSKLIHPQLIERKQRKIALPNGKSILSPMPSSRLILHPNGNGWAI